MSHSLDSLKGVKGVHIGGSHGDYYGIFKEHTKSLDNGSCQLVIPMYP